MGEAITEFTVSLDGFIADSNDEVDRLCHWYRSGDADFSVAGTPMVFRVARQRG